MHQACLTHLANALAGCDEHWIIGSQHWVGAFRPDIVCYYREGIDYARFLENPVTSIRGVVEIKFASGLGRDLEKLTEIQDRWPKCLAWQVYGDHFVESIHPYWHKQHLLRESEILAWRERSPTSRGATILKCGAIQAEERYSATLEAVNRSPSFWTQHARG
jgi:hypothetical protein